MKTLHDFSQQEKERFGCHSSIQEAYDFVRSNPKEQKGKESIQWIHHYMETLYEYSKGCEHITEMGINQVNSTWAFLLANPKKVVSIDIDLHGRPSKKTQHVGTNIWLLNAEELAERAGIEFIGIEGDTNAMQIEETDLLFIDTEHSYKCLKKELELHGNKARKYLVFHDTVLFSHELNPAIEEFMQANPNWVVERVHNSNPGLTVLRNTNS